MDNNVIKSHDKSINSSNATLSNSNAKIWMDKIVMLILNEGAYNLGYIDNNLKNQLNNEIMKS